MNHFTMPAKRTAHYYTLGDINTNITELWIVCHGYGQSAEAFITNFEALTAPHRLIVAPEALSRFYWGGFHGPIAASWMTSKDRLSEIQDYCDWLDQLYAALGDQLNAQVKITLLGFSQGTATIMRWIHARQPRFDRLILWAGMTPEDIDYGHLSNSWPAGNCWLAYGNADKFISAEKVQWQKDFAKAQAIPLQFLVFDGKHRIMTDPLLAIVNDPV